MRELMLVALAAALVVLLPQAQAQDAKPRWRAGIWSRHVVQHAMEFGEIREADRRGTDTAVHLILGSPRVAMANWTGFVAKEHLGALPYRFYLCPHVAQITVTRT